MQPTFSIQPLETAVAPMICTGNSFGDVVGRYALSIATGGIGLIAWCMF